MHFLNLETGLDLDETGRPYVSLRVPLHAVMPYVRWLQNKLDPATMQAYVARQQARDCGRHHLTVVNPLEYPEVKSSLSPLLGYPAHVRMYGVGHIAEPDNEVYFVVCDSPEVVKLREKLGLAHADPHITLGFKVKDIFDRPKDRTSLISPFSDLEDGVGL